MLHDESYFEARPLGRLIHALGGAGLALEQPRAADLRIAGLRGARPGDLIVVARKP